MDTARNIDWSILSYALAYYQAVGYKYIEVPWIVPNSVNMLTCPQERFLMQIAGTHTSLIGSAEQSFLKLDLDGSIPKGRYVACSPCFRREDAYDDWHFPTFMKVELYCTDETDAKAMYRVVGHAEKFFNDQINMNRAVRSPHIHRVLTPDGVDLTLNGVEVGSYGIRGIGFKWVYGTGVALPRFTQAKV